MEKNIMAKTKIDQSMVERILVLLKEPLSGNKTITLVMNYCMNISLPHLVDEQPIELYYYSPISLYCIGIVDSEKKHLYYFVYT